VELTLKVSQVLMLDWMLLHDSGIKMRTSFMYDFWCVAWYSTLDAFRIINFKELNIKQINHYFIQQKKEQKKIFYIFNNYTVLYLNIINDGFGLRVGDIRRYSNDNI